METLPLLIPDPDGNRENDVSVAAGRNYLRITTRDGQTYIVTEGTEPGTLSVTALGASDDKEGSDATTFAE